LSITHDMASARKIAHRVAMLYQGKIIWQGPVADIDRSSNPYVDQFIHGRAEGREFGLDERDRPLGRFFLRAALWCLRRQSKKCRRSRAGGGSGGAAYEFPVGGGGGVSGVAAGAAWGGADGVCGLSCAA
jgi:hypothetical protein